MDNDTKDKLYLTLAIGVAVAVIMLLMTGCYIFATNSITETKQQAQQQVVVTVTPTPTPVPTAVLPQTVTFTVISTSMSPQYTVFTTTGQYLYLTNYYDWNGIMPGYTYTATIVGTQYNGYIINNVIALQRYRYADPPVIIYHNYPVYYYWLGHYYQYDGKHVTPIAYKTIKNEKIIHGKPPIDGDWEYATNTY